MIVQCTHCQTPFTKSNSEVKRSPQHFCSRSCAAKHNNTKYPKRRRTKCCKSCDKKILSNYTYCSDCINQGKHLPIHEHISCRTLKTYLSRKGSYRLGGIRGHARRVAKKWPKKCFVCGYVTKVHVCHRRPIPSFPPDTLISEINAPENLILLCPNHHTEFDMGVLSI